ncbi:MAG TPA: electron transport complex subunit RsxC [Clostridiales bacterium]|nr:electron transport complex subunit RsxC [Clostridiales bacterium]
MNTLTFKNGVHPPYNKELTENKPVTKLLPKEKAVFLMQQHTGAICQPIVKKGDRVLVGQVIADAVASMSAPIHSSISGEVVDIREIPYAEGAHIPAIIIKNDHQYEEYNPIHNLLDYKELSREHIIDIIHKAGIVGMGGAAFPTYIKLNPSNYKKIDSIILNGCECEPYITCDYKLMLNEPIKIVKGLNIILHLFPNAKGYIGIEDNKKEAISAIEKAINDIGASDKIEIKILETKYPQGSEKQLIYAILGREVPIGKLPADIGCIVQNVATSYAIYEAVAYRTPLISRIVTVTGDAIANPQDFWVKLGTPFQDLIDAAGGFIKKPVKIISGGPMMGITMPNTNIPITKATTAILCLTEDAAPIFEEENCIRCGRCVRVCPMNLLPLYLDKFGRRNDIERFEKINGTSCIECGCCAYVCPSYIRIVNSIRKAKRNITANNNIKG